jgi:hypothetical protein
MTGPTTDPGAGAGPWPDPGSGPGHTGRRAQARRPVTIAGAVVALAIAGALGGSWAAGAAAKGTPPPSTAPAPTAGQTATALVPAERLTAALAGLVSGYRFETTVSVNGKTAARAIGRRSGTGSEMTVDAGTASITYRMVPPRSWIRQEGGVWLEAEGSVPDGDPLAALQAPIQVEADPDTEPRSTVGDRLRATYPPTAFGGTGGTPVQVAITFAADGSVTIAYAAPLGVGEGAVVTTLRPEPDQPPIVEPSPGT